MKKIALLGILLIWGVMFSGCNNEENSIDNNNETPSYENELIVEGVTPNAMIGGDIADGSLVVRKIFEDHSEVIFFTPGTWETFFESEDDYLPGNTISFKGDIEGIDAAAGTHYYEAKSINSLEVVAYPTQEEVKELIANYTYCEEDSDCVDFYPGCPLGCSNPINKQYLDIASKIAKSFRNRQDPLCEYGCLAPVKIACENYKCTAVYEEINNGEEPENTDLTKDEIAEANTIFE